MSTGAAPPRPSPARPENEADMLERQLADIGADDNGAAALPHRRLTQKTKIQRMAGGYVLPAVDREVEMTGLCAAHGVQDQAHLGLWATEAAKRVQARAARRREVEENEADESVAALH